MTTKADFDALLAKYDALEARVLEMEARVAAALGSLAAPEPEEAPFTVTDAAPNAPR